MNDWLLQVIRCPITCQPLHVAKDAVVAELKLRQSSAQLISHKGIPIEDPFEAGLVNQSNSYFYRVQDGIPSLLPDEAIAL